LDAKGISIPFPQHDLHLHNVGEMKQPTAAETSAAKFLNKEKLYEYFFMDFIGAFSWYSGQR
jgi:hypothetical protein